jgi:hypothetical protein
MCVAAVLGMLPRASHTTHKTCFVQLETETHAHTHTHLHTQPSAAAINTECGTPT